MDLASPQQHRPRARSNIPRQRAVARQRRVSLCETLDRVLNKGAVIAGDVIISVAGIDLLYLGLNVVVTSIETMRTWDSSRPERISRAPAPNPSSTLQQAEP